MNRRGVAMLLVLAASVVLLSTAAIIARVRATQSLTQRTEQTLIEAWAVCEGAEPAVLAWLEQESREVVIDPDLPAPMVRLLDESFWLRGKQVRITLTAWDQHGMLPRTTVAQSTALRSLADRLGLDRVDLTETESPGIDLMPAGSFPRADYPTAPGGMISTHNPPPGAERRRDGSIASINVNTTPEPLLRALFEDLDRGDIDQVLGRRRSGERAEIHSSSTATGGGDPVRLVGSSGCWSVRTDVRITGPGNDGGGGGASASIWSVYSLRGGAWIREQRLVIPE
jgi:hypothetical protein